MNRSSSESEIQSKPINRTFDNLTRFFESDIFFSFKKSHLAVFAFFVTLILFLSALFANWLAPHQTLDVKTLDLMNAFYPPLWEEGSDSRFLLGTDDQGRDIFSAIMFGLRISLGVGFASVILSAALGTVLGLISGYFGWKLDSFIMRVADIQLTFPAILIALLIDGIVGSLLPKSVYNEVKIYVLVMAIAASQWVNFARTVRGSTLVEKNKEYVSASRIIGLSNVLIMFKHILPNILRPILVIATIGLALAIITESTLSFLGVGVPPTTPSLGTLIRFGNNFLFSGEWWITFFPAIFLVVLALSINLLGDWMRDALNPKLKKR